MNNGFKALQVGPGNLANKDLGNCWKSRTEIAAREEMPSLAALCPILWHFQRSFDNARHGGTPYF